MKSLMIAQHIVHHGLKDIHLSILSLHWISGGSKWKHVLWLPLWLWSRLFPFFMLRFSMNCSTHYSVFLRRLIAPYEYIFLSFRWRLVTDLASAICHTYVTFCYSDAILTATVYCPPQCSACIHQVTQYKYNFHHSSFTCWGLHSYRFSYFHNTNFEM